MQIFLVSPLLSWIKIKFTANMGKIQTNLFASGHGKYWLVEVMILIKNQFVPPK